MVNKASAGIGKRLYLARTRRNLTMADLATKADISGAAISYIESGTRKPTADTVEGLARALDIDPCWLAYGTGEVPDWNVTQDNH